MAQKFEINAKLREQYGTNVMRRLRRREGQIPAIIYGGGEDPQAITLSHQEIRLALENEAIFSHILKLILNGKNEQVVIKHVQRHPYKPQILHVDFQRILASEMITVSVPIHFLNENKAPGVLAGGIVSHLIMEAEVQCLPADLPEFVNLDLATLQAGDSLHLTDLQLPAGVSLAMGELQDERFNKTVASIHLHRGTTADEAADAKAAQSSASAAS